MSQNENRTGSLDRPKLQALSVIRRCSRGAGRIAPGHEVSPAKNDEMLNSTVTHRNHNYFLHGTTTVP